MNGVRILVGSKTLAIEVKGERILFEDNAFMGPAPVTKAGAARSLGPRHRFWDAVTLWVQQGRRVGPDGLCVWEPESDPLAGAAHIVGRHYVVPGPDGSVPARAANTKTKARAGALLAAEDSHAG